MSHFSYLKTKNIITQNNVHTGKPYNINGAIYYNNKENAMLKVMSKT